MASKHLHRRLKHSLRWKAAQWWLKMHPEVEVIAIAGSVGKTTTKEAVAAVLAEAFPIVKSRANFDPIFNLPQTALRIRNREKFVAEMGIDGPGQMEKYLTLFTPSIAIMTELSLEHTDSDHLQSLEMAIAEEWKLIEGMPTGAWAIMNGDNDDIRCQRSTAVTCQTLLYGFGEHNHVRIARTTQNLNNGQAQLTIALTGQHAGEYTAPFLGAHNALCMTAAICVGKHYGMTDQAIQAGLERISPPEHRLQIHPTPWGHLIDDTYNSSPKAAMAAIDVLIQLNHRTGVLVLGDMLELGNYATSAHQQVGEYAAKQGIETVLAYGAHAVDIQTGYTAARGKGKVIIIDQRADIDTWVRQNQPELLLLKASRGMQLNEVAKHLITSQSAS